MKKIVTLIPGDGIGPEIAKSLTDIFSAAEVPVVFEIENAGTEVYEKTGELIPESSGPGTNGRTGHSRGNESRPNPDRSGRRIRPASRQCPASAFQNPPRRRTATCVGSHTQAGRRKSGVRPPRSAVDGPRPIHGARRLPANRRRLSASNPDG